MLRGRGGPNSLPLCGGKKIAVITGFAREETVDDNRLDSESQSDKCGYNERDYVEETRDGRSVSSHERIDMNCHGEKKRF